MLKISLTVRSTFHSKYFLYSYNEAFLFRKLIDHTLSFLQSRRCTRWILIQIKVAQHFIVVPNVKLHWNPLSCYACKTCRHTQLFLHMFTLCTENCWTSSISPLLLITRKMILEKYCSQRGKSCKFRAEFIILLHCASQCSMLAVLGRCGSSTVVSMNVSTNPCCTSRRTWNSAELVDQSAKWRKRWNGKNMNLVTGQCFNWLLAD